MDLFLTSFNSDQKSRRSKKYVPKIANFSYFLGLCGKVTGEVCSYFFEATKNLVAAQMVLALADAFNLTLCTNKKL
jgi:CheY-specific phosphatase CheX